MPKLLLGPVLGLENGERYTVCVACGAEVASLSLQVGDRRENFQKIHNEKNWGFWRAEFQAPPGVNTYRVLENDVPLSSMGVTEWSFHVPAPEEEPRLLFCSCNGFSSGSAFKALKNRAAFAMWERAREKHKTQPYDLMIMGGDQVYADELYQVKDHCEPLYAWFESSRKDQMSYNKKNKDGLSNTLNAQIDRFYAVLYPARWGRDKNMAWALASIPSIMMWDDHDIFDGYGSYDEEIHRGIVHQTLFTHASKYFDLFQLRGREQNSIHAPARGQRHRFGVLDFRKFRIILMDARSERTLDHVLSEEQWTHLKKHLAVDPRKIEALFVVIAVPPVYLNMKLHEWVLRAVPGTQELEDDLFDHWSSPRHQGEQARLFYHLIERVPAGVRTLILSGDVHVGGVGTIQSEGRIVHQVISSGIVHPEPGPREFAGLQATSGDGSGKSQAIRYGLVDPAGAGGLLRTRNFATITRKRGGEKGKQKIWVEWTCENGLAPTYVTE